MTLFELFFLLLATLGLVLLAYHMHLEAKATKRTEDLINVVLDVLDEKLK